jgi:hypothetical protein
MRNVLRALGLSLAVFLFSSSAVQAQKVAGFKEKTPTVPLAEVISATESALNDYQTLAQEDQTKALPPLATADFDFKTVVDTKGGVVINLFIFTLGASHEKQQTNELDFQYMPHVQPKTGFMAFDGGKAPTTLYQQLIDTLTESAKEIKRASDQPQVPGTNQLDLCQLSLSVSFGVTTDVQGGIKAPIQLITLTASLDRSRNNVQQVKLVFKVKDPSNTTCVQPKT